MVVIAWVIAVISVFGWWVLRLDTPDRNPFVLARVYRFLALVLLALVLVLSYKSIVWNRDVRSLILETCQ